MTFVVMLTEEQARLMRFDMDANVEITFKTDIWKRLLFSITLYFDYMNRHMGEFETPVKTKEEMEAAYEKIAKRVGIRTKEEVA